MVKLKEIKTRTISDLQAGRIVGRNTLHKEIRMELARNS